jgi:hypothetical protein
MNSSRAAALLRNIQFDTSAELTQYNTQQLPDGATAFVNETNALYRLDKTLGTTLDGLLGSGDLVVPADQSAARWLAETVSGSSPYYHSSYLTAAVAVPMTSSQWAALGVTAGSFGISQGSSLLYTLSATTGQITYNGPTRIAMVTMQASLLNSVGATPIEVHACVSRNGDVVAGGTGDFDELGEQAASLTNVLGVITVRRIVSLVAGTTLRMMLRNATNGDDLTASYYQATVESI